MLNEGTKAPDFALEGKDKKIIKLSDFLGKKVIVYFYPKDNTPGCTKQACAFASIFGQFEEKGIIVIGISKDSPASHEKFATKYELPFLLLSDPVLLNHCNKGYLSLRLPYRRFSLPNHKIILYHKPLSGYINPDRW